MENQEVTSHESHMSQLILLSIAFCRKFKHFYVTMIMKHVVLNMPLHFIE